MKDANMDLAWVTLVRHFGIVSVRLSYGKIIIHLEGELYVCIRVLFLFVFFSNSDQFSWHQIGDLKFNSILTFLPGVSVRSHKLSAQSHKTASASPTPSDANRKPRLSPVFLSDWIYIGGSHTPPWFNNLLEWLTELRKTVYLPVYYRRIQFRNN